MPLKLDMSSAEEMRSKLTQSQETQIRELYEQAARNIAAEAEKAPRVPSDTLRQQYLNALHDQITDAIREVGKDTQKIIQDNMVKTAKAAVDSNKQFLVEVGMPSQGAFSHVPTDVVQSIITGKLYEGNWSLSKALWRAGSSTQRDVESIIAKGIAENRSAYDIAKDLERYVNPKAAKDWEWSKVYPGTSRRVDYNAQRLARTMVSHAYQQSFVRTTQKNPFVTKYRWLSSGGERMCPICEDRDGKDFAKDDLPLDHPNGMCTFVAVIEDSMTDIADRLADWAQGKSDPAIDSYVKDLYGSSQMPEQVKSVVLNRSPSTTKDLTSKWGIPVQGIQGKAVQNADTALSYMQETFGVDPKNYISAIDIKNPAGLRAYSAYYSSADRGIHVHRDDKKDFDTGTWVHEFTHALNGGMAQKFNLTSNNMKTVTDDIVRTAYADLGYKMNPRTGIPYKADMAKVTAYGGTNSMECVAEAEEVYYLYHKDGELPPELIERIHKENLKRCEGLK